MTPDEIVSRGEDRTPATLTSHRQALEAALRRSTSRAAAAEPKPTTSYDMQDEIEEESDASYEDDETPAQDFEEVEGHEPTMVYEPTRSRDDEIVIRGVTKTKIALHHADFELSFEVACLDIQEDSLSFLMNSEAAGIKPRMGGQYTLECLGKSYTVVYVGALTALPGTNYNMVSFIINTD